MKIHDTETRDCCQPQDLKPVQDARIQNGQRLMFCVHCGHRHYVGSSTLKPDALRDPIDHTV